MILLIGFLKESAGFIAPYKLLYVEVKVSRALFSLSELNPEEKDLFLSHPVVLGAKGSHLWNSVVLI